MIIVAQEKFFLFSMKQYLSKVTKWYKTETAWNEANSHEQVSTGTHFNT